MPALAQLVGHEPQKPLSWYEYYLPLSDVLVVLAKPATGAGAPHYEELAESLANDVLNLANLAARLLWLEGVSPDIWRSPDIITVSVDTESYFIMLQSACDVMVDVITTFGAVKKGQVPRSKAFIG